MSWTPSRIGQANATGDALALFLKKYAGEVFVAFNERNVVMGRHLVRTLENGKSASFPATWKVDAYYHTPGNELPGLKKAKYAERVINIDSPLLVDTLIPALARGAARRRTPPLPQPAAAVRGRGVSAAPSRSGAWP